MFGLLKVLGAIFYVIEDTQRRFSKNAATRVARATPLKRGGRVSQAVYEIKRAGARV